MSNETTLLVLALAGTIMARNWAGFHRMIEELNPAEGTIQLAHLMAVVERAKEIRGAA